MNFSTIVERVVAPKMARTTCEPALQTHDGVVLLIFQVRDEQSKKNAATFPQFFSRFPRLYPFLLHKFQEQMAQGGEVFASPLVSFLLSCFTCILTPVVAMVDALLFLRETTP